MTNIKRIILLSFLHENDTYIRMFKILRDHYLKLIDKLNLPIRYYGVRITDKESFIDEENHMIMIHNIGDDYDKKLVLKVRDTFEFIENNLEYDIIVKGNASTIINLPRLNNHLQYSEYDGVVWCGQCWFPAWPIRDCNIIARGNLLCLPKYMIDNIISEFRNIEYFQKNYIERAFENAPQSIKDNYNPYILDDFYISMCVANICSGVFPIDRDGAFLKLGDADGISKPPETLLEIISRIGVNIKTYHDIYTESMQKTYNNPDIECLDIILLKLIIDIYERFYFGFEKFA